MWMWEQLATLLPFLQANIHPHEQRPPLKHPQSKHGALPALQGRWLRQCIVAVQELSPVSLRSDVKQVDACEGVPVGIHQRALHPHRRLPVGTRRLEFAGDSVRLQLERVSLRLEHE